MRSNFKFLYAMALGASLALTGCDGDEFPSPEFATGGKGYVAFQAAGATIGESVATTDAEGNGALVNNTHKIVVYRSSEKYDEAVTVNISMAATYLSDSDFASAGEDASEEITVVGTPASLVIPAGEVSASFFVSTTEDVLSTGDVRVVFQITGASGIYTPGAAQAGIGTSYNLVVQDDDCPISLADWAGAYQVGDFCGSVGAVNEGFCSSDLSGLNVTLEPNAADPAGISAFLVGLATEPIPITFNTCPKTVSFSGTHIFASPVEAIPNTGMAPTNFATRINYYDESKFEIVISVDLVAGATNYGAFDLILTKK